MSPTQWVPAIVAIVTVIANAAVTHSAVSRHEREIAALEGKVQALCTKVAVLEERLRGGEHA